MALVCVLKTEIGNIEILSATNDDRPGLFKDKCKIFQSWGEWYPLGKKSFFSGYAFSYRAIVMAHYLGFDLTGEEGVKQAVDNSEHIRREYSMLVAKYGCWENIVAAINNNISNDNKSKIDSDGEMSLKESETPTDEGTHELPKLINCPDCNKEVSRRAIACPNCGCPISKTTKGLESISTSKPSLPINHGLPMCPTCQSTVVEKISLKSKAGKVALVGIFAIGKVSKTFKCNTCGYQW
ncbi:MAG: hypothetical protein HZC48_08540 [Nitrospirae bacterium]|nr:hypothetical protein [Nitrospirota bacterium]